MWTTGLAPEEALPKRPRIGGVGKGKGAKAKAKAKPAPKSKGRGSRANATALAAAVSKDEPSAPNPPNPPMDPPNPPNWPNMQKPKKPRMALRRKAPGPPVRRSIVKKVPLDGGEKEATLKKARRRAA
jgi:hypothetical protein